MTPLALNATYLFSAGVVVLQILAVVVFFLLIQKKEVSFLSKKSFHIIFLTALLATLGSLFYSEVIGFVPCNLCWYQRIFMYPQVVLLLVAYWKKDKTMVIDYVMWLSLIGLLIAGYHYYGQMINTSVLPCNSPGIGATCSSRPFATLGYITIPMMALTSFVSNFLLCIYHKKFKGFNS